MERRTFEEELIMQIIPKLKEDTKWHKTSPVDANYNCVAWVFGKKDINIWPAADADEEFYLNDRGLWVFWPNNIQKSRTLENFSHFFESVGFEICDDNWDYEEGYRKIALYSSNGVDMSHVAIEGNDDLWHSKLGYSIDIVHSTPLTIECEEYGLFKIAMKRKYDKK